MLPDETGLTGPNLFGAVGRKVVTVARYDDLDALPARGYLTWTEAALDAFLTSPQDLAPGTAMTFVGMPGAQERADLIAYLASHAVGRE